jgi:phosphatidate cytidylyltransferase
MGHEQPQDLDMTAVMDSAPYVVGVLGAGGVGVAISRKRELIARWCTWAAAAPIVGGSLAFGAPGAVTLAIGLGAVAAWEYARLLRLRPTDLAVLLAAVVAVPLTSWLAPSVLARPGVLFLVPLAAALPALLGGDGRDGARRAAYVALGAAWLAGLSGLVLLGSHALAVCLAVSVADVAAWCGGRLLGRRGLGARCLSPLSPAKTWAGVAGAAIGAVSTLAVVGEFRWTLVIAVLAGAVVGDLFESMLKRGAGVKDAGAWLPGFGGLLDRIDSLLVALAVAVVLS